MIEFFNLIWLMLCLLLLPVYALYFLAFKDFIKIMKGINNYDLEEFKGLGFIKGNDIVTSSKFVKFVLMKEYDRIGSSELSSAGNKCRILLIVGFALFVVAFFIPILIGALRA